MGIRIDDSLLDQHENESTSGTPEPNLARINQKQVSIPLKLRATGVSHASIRIKWDQPMDRQEIKEPPKFELFLIALLTGPRDREAMTGDTVERFRKEADKFGERKARMLLLRDIVATIGSRLIPLVRRLAKWLFIGHFIDKYFHG